MKVSCEQKKLYRSNASLSHILKCNENIHKDIFREGELKSLSPSHFSVLLSSQLLSETYQDLEQTTYYDENKTAYRVRKDENDYIGYRIRGEGEATIVLRDEDKKHFKFNLKKFCQLIKTKNGLTGNIDTLSQRIWFLGRHAVLNSSMSVVLVFFCDDKTAEKELYALQSRITQPDKIVALCPSYQIKSMELLKNLEGKNIYCYGFDKILDDFFQIDFSKVPADEKTQGFKIPVITQKEKAGYNAHDYKCRDVVEFVGQGAKNRQIRISVNKNVTDVKYSEAALLMYMAIKLKKNSGGWVSLDDMSNEEIVPTANQTKTNDFTRMHRLVSDLRGTLKKVQASDDIIQGVSGKGQYRLSTHPLRAKEPSSNWLKQTYKHTVLPAVKAERAKRIKTVKS